LSMVCSVKYLIGFIMTDSHTQWRLGLAEQLAQKIKLFAGVRAIVVGGSVARGYADEYSDLELIVIWEVLPEDDARRALVAALNADFLYAYDGPSREDQLLVKDFQIDLWHNTIAGEEKVIQAVLERYSTDLSDSNFMDTLRHCMPLYGEKIINKWKQRALRYPPELAIRNIRSQISELDPSQMALFIHRANPFMFYNGLCRLQKAVFLILLALNGAYFPTFKWMYQSIADLPIKPEDVEGRFRRMFSLPYEEALTDMRHIVDATLNLVERHYPQIDTTAARLRLAYTRKAHPQPINLGDDPRLLDE
jgi:hypothetical protein